MPERGAGAVRNGDIHAEPAHITFFKSVRIGDFEIRAHCRALFLSENDFLRPGGYENASFSALLLRDTGQDALQAGVQEGGLPVPAVSRSLHFEAGPALIPGNFSDEPERRTVVNAQPVHGVIIGPCINAFRERFRSRCVKSGEPVSRRGRGLGDTLPGSGSSGFLRSEKFQPEIIPSGDGRGREFKEDVFPVFKHKGRKDAEPGQDRPAARFPAAGRGHELDKEAGRSDGRAAYFVIEQ